MTSVKIPETPLEKMRAFQDASVAGQFAQKGDTAYEVGALENLRNRAGTGNLCEGFYQGAIITPQGRQRATQVYGGEFAQAIGDITVKDLMKYFEDTNGGFKLSGYFSETELKIMRAKLKPYEDLKLGDIEKSGQEAIGILKAVQTGESKATYAQIREANVNKMVYNEVGEVLNDISDMNTDVLKREAVITGTNNSLGERKKGLLERMIGDQ